MSPAFAAAPSKRRRSSRPAASVRSLALTLVLGCAGAVPAFGQDEDLDDLMGGFDDDFDVESLEEDLDDSPPEWLVALPGGAWAYENVRLSGSVATAAVWSYLSHTAATSEFPGDTDTTDFGGLSRLDLDGFLQLDVTLPGDWLFRAEGLGWYDFAYRINGRSDYNGAVLDVYEWQVDTGELYVEGPLSDAFDLAIGRKIVNWGRSDTFRVVDVVNALDNKEPGLVDIEDIRRPVGMVKLDFQSGPWSAQLLTIVEARYDRQPPPGSDFIPDVFTDPTLGGGNLAGAAPIRGQSDWGRTPGLAGKIDGRFSGWDFSIYGAWVDETQRTVDPIGAGVQAEPNRYGMVGAAGNVTRGPILLKAEMAFLTGVRTLRFAIAPQVPPTPPGLALLNQERDRLDTMVGVEWYGPDQLTVALEIVHRHLFDHPGGQPIGAPGDPPGQLELTPADRFDTALRITRPFFRERLDVTLLGLVSGERMQDGGLVRASAEYELTDALKMDVGWLVFFGGPRLGLGAFDSNDRIYGELKYSF